LHIILNWCIVVVMTLVDARELEIDSLQSLEQARVGCDLRIHALDGPACEQLRRLGFCETMRVRKLSDGRNLVCTVCGIRMALSRELAAQVMVAPLHAA